MLESNLVDKIFTGILVVCEYRIGHHLIGIEK